MLNMREKLFHVMYCESRGKILLKEKRHPEKRGTSVVQDLPKRVKT